MAMLGQPKSSWIMLDWQREGWQLATWKFPKGVIVSDIPLLLACEIPRFFLGFHGNKRIPATVHVGGSLLVQMIIVTSRVRDEGIQAW